MDELRYGIMTARRGWVQPGDVINTWSVERFIEWTAQRGK
jgi:DNA polymerase (family 10)